MQSVKLYYWVYKHFPYDAISVTADCRLPTSLLSVVCCLLPEKNATSLSEYGIYVFDEGKSERQVVHLRAGRGSIFEVRAYNSLLAILRHRNATRH